MILGKNKIEEAISKGDIVITPFKEDRLNPNSYNVSLHKELMVYDSYVLDMKAHNTAKKMIIPKSGLVLEPGKLYLGRTNEYTETFNYVPMLEGRSSIGRLGMGIHVTAGFGDCGFKGFWTLEIYVIQPLVIYPDVEIGQLYYHTIDGEPINYNGKYLNNSGIQPSKLYEEL